jgi:hypothetical protein
VADSENIDPRRGEQRFRCALAVTLRRRGTDEHLLTSDVSFRGAYIRTGSPPPANSLVRLAFTLPPDDAKITISAHVARVAMHDDARDQYPGFVARFVGLDGPVKERWERLISWVRTEHGHSVRKSVSFARPSYVRLFQQKAPSGDDVWMLPDSVEELQRIIREEVPTGTVVAKVAAKVSPGVNVTVRLVHPITEAVVMLPGVVRRRGDEVPADDGVPISLLPLTDALRGALTEMDESVVVLEDYDVELYSEPSLEPVKPRA